MDKYLLSIIILIIFAIILILYIRISAKVSKNILPEQKPKTGDFNDDSIRYDNVSKQDSLANLKSDDFTLLE